jgi:hypothetical protein
MEDFEGWYRYFLEREKQAWEEGWRAGWEAGRKNYFDARKEDWEEVLGMSTLFEDQAPSLMEMEEWRYGVLPEGFEGNDTERRSARARNPRPGDYLGSGT